jgi:ligand-binding sensor domain-containing protein/signal transduction histidine kinase
MKLLKPTVLVFILVSLLLSCRNSKQQEITSHPLMVVEAKGHSIPADSIMQAQIISVSESDFKISPVINLEAVVTNTNIHNAITNKTIRVGEVTIVTPGKDSFLLPLVSAALDSQITIGPKEIVTAKDMAIKDPNPANFTYFTKLQGLKHIAVHSLVQDKAGNIWIGSRGGGLSRFDGQTFTHISKIPALASNRVMSLIEDKDGNMWFGSEVNGVFKYDGKNFMRLIDQKRMMNGFVKTIFQDHNGNIWFGTTKSGVFKYDGKNFTQYSSKQGLSNNVVTNIIEDKKGNIWIGTEKGVNKFDGIRFSHYNTQNGLPDNSIRCLLEDKQGNIWMGTDSAGIVKYNGQQFTNFTKKEGLSSNTISSLLEDKAGNIWMGTEGAGAIKFDGIRFTHYDEAQGFPSKEVRCMLEDRSGNIWFGNYGSLGKLSGIPFNHFTVKDGLLFNQNWSILEDKKGNKWFGSTAGLCKYDGKQFIAYTRKNGLPLQGTIRSMTEDHNGNIWIGFGDGGGGFAKFDGNQFFYFKDPISEKGNAVQDVIEDRYGNMWFANYGNGVYKYDGKSLTIFTTKQGLPSNSTNTLTEDRNGNIWITTSDAGVAKYDGKKFTIYNTKDGLPGNNVWAGHEDKVGNLWFGTEAGAARYDGKYFTAFTEKEGMAGSYPLTITEDHDGNMWFITRNGVNRLPKEKALQSYLEVKSNESGVDENLTLITSFEYADGFLGMGGQSGKTILTDHNGMIWACSNDRVSIFNTAAENKSIEPPKTRLTAISLYEEPIDWNAVAQNRDSNFVLANGVDLKVSKIRFDSIVKWHSFPANLSLPYNNNYITFYYTGITMYQPGKIKYQHKLEGNTEHWSGLTNSNKASYSNLSPGKYTFKVKAMNSQGQWSNEFAYNFSVRPPWWKTWWAYTLYVILIAITIGAYVRYRSGKLIKENALLEQKVERRTAELNQSILNLKATQQQLVQSEKMASLGELTAGIAHEIQNPLNFVNNFSEVSAELTKELVDEVDKGNTEEVRAIAKDLESNLKKINYHGQRAADIVKGMLQHSRSNSGVKEPTDINALCDEYLRLAYHGLRAKDKTFNAKFETDLDTSIQKINVMPQDIGRVILNLINNAFYAVSEKKKVEGEGSSYEPTVSISTKKTADKIEIKVTDNGTGIPQKVLDKIFQPFFTTKPTGLGTGLGLSLSYDIVKAHGGTLTVETKENEGTSFIINLPNAQA